MICDEHLEVDCPVCYARNPAWEPQLPHVSFSLTENEIKRAVRTIKTNAAVMAARRRNTNATD